MKRLVGHFLADIGISRYFQWRCNTFFMSWLPFHASRTYLNLLGKIYFSLNRGEKQKIQQNLTAVMEHFRPQKQLDLVSQRALHGMFAHYHEKLFTAYGGFSRVCRFLQEHVSIKGRPLLDEALAQGRGVILVTGHYGGIEFLPSILALRGYRVTMLVRFNSRRLKQILNQHAQRVGISLLDMNQNGMTPFKALQSLKANRILITECDEFRSWRPHRHRRATFLGFSTPLDRTLDLLYRRYRSPVITGFMERRAGNRYELTLEAVDCQESGSTSGPIAERVLQVLERYIGNAPEQWYLWGEVRAILGQQIPLSGRPVADRRSGSDACRAPGGGCEGVDVRSNIDPQPSSLYHSK
ncbi:MAG: lysophospholipid acyltransferase family protein [Deltaproteobacteria bacterium]|nr:lysophospholipid acyltransferase family protein [Deltaproteobacteria bacterium]MBW2069747.1 lysophospholipid acyltransferase family protein [Deltaproteobacteria bacterium]